MENRLDKKIILIISLIMLSACDMFEFRGFVLSYESADERFRQSVLWNSNHSVKEIEIADDMYSIYAMGDSHVGGTNNLDVFISGAIANSAAAVVMAGDITTGHADDYAVLYEHVPDADSIESFLMVGNHDLYFGGWDQFYSLFGSSTYTFIVNTPEAKDLFICLDTGSGTLGSEQLDWLRNTLKTERAYYRYCILFTHNNLFRNRHTTSTNPLVEELYVLLDLTIEYDVDMVVTGHDHKKYVETFGNTTYVTMNALQDDYDNAGYFVLLIDQGEIRYEFIDL
jgi:predicted phosphodiesterase